MTMAETLSEALGGPGGKALKDQDLMMVIRHGYANRCPLLARLPWVPGAPEDDEFNLYTHRYMAKPEKAQGGFTTVGETTKQWYETFERPVPSNKYGFDFNFACQLQNMADDIETAFYYGKGGKGKVRGLQSIIRTNLATAPKHTEAYSPDEFVRDTVQKARVGGGEPDVMLLSTSWMSQFASWKVAMRMINAGETPSCPIRVFEAPEFLPGVNIIEAPLLKPRTAITLTSPEIYVRNKVSPQLRNGDTLYAEMSIEVVNENHFGFLRPTD